MPSRGPRYLNALQCRGFDSRSTAEAPYLVVESRPRQDGGMEPILHHHDLPAKGQGQNILCRNEWRRLVLFRCRGPDVAWRRQRELAAGRLAAAGVIADGARYELGRLDMVLREHELIGGVRDDVIGLVAPVDHA